MTRGAVERPLSRAAAALTLVALLPAAVQLMVVIHESGHALAARALGATIREFEVGLLAGKPHVSYTGLPEARQAVATVAGPGLTLLAWLAWLLATRGRGSVWHRKALFVGAVGALFPLAAWTVLPLLHAAGRRVRDDSVSFVRLAAVSPYVVSAIALSLLGGCLWLYVRWVDVEDTFRARLTPIVSPRVHALVCAVLLLAVVLGSLAAR